MNRANGPEGGVEILSFFRIFFIFFHFFLIILTRWSGPLARLSLYNFYKKFIKKTLIKSRIF